MLAWHLRFLYLWFVTLGSRGGFFNHKPAVILPGLSWALVLSETPGWLRTAVPFIECRLD